MADDDSLETTVSPQVSADNFARPKLKKIKRPKIHPIADTPAAPTKVFADDSSVESASINADELHIETDTAIPQEEGENSTPQSTGMSLVTSREAQDLKVSNNNPYIINGLPPELDYIQSDDENEFEEEDDDEDFVEQRNVRKRLFFISFACLIIGVIVGALLFSSKNEEKKGLEGVVFNDDVPSGRPRCGLTDASQACVFYIMNCYKQELTGRDFYALAATLTSRETYMIETANLRYANVKIKPGYFAQLSIPALK